MRVFALLLFPVSLIAAAPALAQAALPPTMAPPSATTPGKPISLYDLMGVKPPGLRGAELEAAVVAAAPFALGSSQNPVRTRGIDGQRAYLARLRCPDRKRPKVLGRGLGPPSPFGGVGDSYGVTCAGARHQIEMDMYHDHVEPRPVPGFTIVAR